ncbi:MAG: hypothetical protein HQL72_07070 [Magnetococcales bacterium]|nr:hypothetical protein [Magnetococcales bacterium]
MTIRRINQIELGMVLKGDVCDKSGRLLLAKGVSITERHIMVLMTWGVTEVDADRVQAVDEDAVSDATTLINRGSTSPQVEALFSHVDINHPLMKELFYYCCRNQPLEGEDHGG